MQGHAQECPDQDDQAEGGDVLQRALDHHGPDDVAGDQELQAEDDGPPQLPPEILVGGARGQLPVGAHKNGGRHERTDGDHQHAGRLDGVSGQGDNFGELHGAVTSGRSEYVWSGRKCMCLC